MASRGGRKDTGEGTDLKKSIDRRLESRSDPRKSPRSVSNYSQGFHAPKQYCILSIDSYQEGIGRLRAILTSHHFHSQAPGAPIQHNAGMRSSCKKHLMFEKSVAGFVMLKQKS
eukprot:768670-Hanusia_phi.AAC.2